MRILALPTIGVLFIGLTASVLGCSGSTPASPGTTQGGSSGGPAELGGSGSSGGSGGAAVAVGGSSSGSSGGPSVAGTGASAGAGGSAGSAVIGGAGAAGASPGGACDKSMATWTDTSDLYASQDFGPNFLRKNFWNSRVPGAGTLTLWAASSRCWGVDATSIDDMTNPENIGQVKSYPDMARGWVVGTAGFQNKNSGLPIQVKDLTKAKIRWKMTVSGSPLRHYALWDIYFHDTATPGRGTATVNLMIKQRVVDPSNYEQDKESAGSAAVTHTFGGITFRENKNTGLKSGSRAIVELFATPVNGVDMGVDDMTLDLKEVIDFYVKDGSILTTDYLTSIQTGWEIVAGGSFVTNDFWTALQDEPEPTN